MRRLGPEPATMLNHPAGLAGAAGIASIVLVADDIEGYKETVRTALETLPVFGGVTEVNSIMLVRLLGPDAAALRRIFGEVWARLRHDIAGLPARLPRLWHC